MSKKYASQRKKAQGTDRPAMLKTSGGARSMPPPPFQLKTSDVVQREPDGSTSFTATPAAEFGGVNEAIKKAGGQNGHEEGNTERSFGFKGGESVVSGNDPTLSTSHTEDNMTTHHGSDNVTVQSGDETKLAGEITKDGVHAQAEHTEALSKIEVQFPRTYDFKLFGEDSQMALNFKIEAFVGAEAKAGVQAMITNVFAKKDPDKIGKQDLLDIQRGIDVGAEGFVGGKLKVMAEAKHYWKKKDAGHYEGKIRSNIANVKSMLSSGGGEIGAKLSGLPEDKLAKLITKVLYSDDNPSLLAVVGSFVEGSFGAGVMGQFSWDFSGGMVKFTSKAGATWGLGLGGGVEVGVDLKDGLLFGMANGGEIYNAVKDKIADAIDWWNGEADDYDYEKRQEMIDRRESVRPSASSMGMTE